MSGGHTQLIAVREIGRYEQLGTTLDDAAGEVFDKTAKLLGLDYPGGPQVEIWAAKGDARRFAFPRPMRGRPELDFSFSGLKTALRHAALPLAPLSDGDIADLCASFQAAVVEALGDRVSAGLARFAASLPPDAPKHLVAAGGVAANKAIRVELGRAAASHGFELHLPPLAFCTDNAAMIAWTGAERLARGWKSTLDAPARPRWPLAGLSTG